MTCTPRGLTLGVLCALTVSSAAARQAAPAAETQGEAPVTLEIRVFDGTEEVTSRARIQLFEAGSKTASETIRAPSGPATTEVSPGVYDLQAVLEREGTVAGGMRWARQRLIQRYPDQHGRQLEVLNMQRSFGALQIRRRSTAETGAETGAVAWKATLYQVGDATAEVTTSLPGDGYVLLIAAAGTYDVQVTPPDGDPVWLREVELPADQTGFRTW